MSRGLVVRAAALSCVLIPAVIYLSSHHTGSSSGKATAEYARQLYSSLSSQEDQLSSGERGSWFSSGGWRGGQAVQQEAWLDLDVELPLTSYAGGIPGYTVFENLYLSSATLLAVTDPVDDDIPPPGSIMSGEKLEKGGHSAAGEDRWRVVDELEAGEELGKRALVLRGTTYIFNDPPGTEGYLVYFEHFVLECFVGAARILGSVFPSSLQNILPARVWFPRCGIAPQPTWRDARGENVWFLTHAAPDVGVEDIHGFEDRTMGGLPVLLERAVIVDRWSAHSVGGETARWGKVHLIQTSSYMNANVPLVEAPLDYWEPIRRNMLRSSGVDHSSKHGTRGLPVVVYIDRQRDSPKLSDASHEALIEALKGLTDIAEVHVTKLGGMTKAQQVDLMGRAEVVLSLHADELRQQLWMKATGRSAVIEVFEEGCFIRDHQLLATNLNHKYYLVHKDRVVAEEEWQKLGRVVGKASELDVDAGFIANLIREIIQTPPTL